jgi:hypothetical protein
VAIARSDNRPGFVRAAVTDARSLQKVVNKLTEAEVDEALEVEAAGVRRQAMIRRLIRRKLRLVEVRTRKELEARYARSE